MDQGSAWSVTTKRTYNIDENTMDLTVELAEQLNLTP
jgi:hypothetical protein